MPETQSPRRAGRFVGAALVLAALVSAPLAIAGVRGSFGGGWHGCDHAPPASATELRERMDMPAERLADHVDATDAQRAEIDAALDTLAPRLWELKSRHEDLREDAHAAFAADQVDRAELDALRKEGIQLADEASVAVLDAVYRVATSLSAEQRRDLVDTIEEWHR